MLFNSALRDNLANGDTYLSRGSIAGIIVAGKLAIDTETIKSISLAFNSNVSILNINGEVLNTSHSV